MDITTIREKSLFLPDKRHLFLNKSQYFPLSGTYLCIKNGQATYDKKAAKNMTPKQARNNTSTSRITSTRQFEPID